VKCNCRRWVKEYRLEDSAGKIRVQDVFGKYFLRNHVTNSCFTKRKLWYACFIRVHVFRTPLRIRKNIAFTFYVKSTQFPLEFFGFTYLK
jgi:hypothetical protein